MPSAGGIEAAGSTLLEPGAKRADIQGLRAVAVLLVIAYHLGAPGLPGGFVGVDVFFAISGFVIVSLLDREQRQRGRISVAGFYARRARRILPAATVVALLTVVSSYWWLGYLAGNRVAGVARWSAVFLANFHFYWAGTSYFKASDPVSPLLHYWSLGVEEQFYLLVPLLALAAGALARRLGRLEPRRLMALVLVPPTLASLFLSVTRSASDPSFAYFLPYTRAWELGAGALVALLVPRRRWPVLLALPLSWLGLGAIALAAVSFGPSTTYPGAAALLPVLGTVLLVALGPRAARGSANQLLGSRPATWVGDRSFSLYLVSFPLVTVATEAAGHRLGRLDRLAILAATFALAELCFRLVEHPVLASPRLKTSTRLSLLLGAGLVLLGLLAPSLAIATHRDASGGWIRPAAPTTLAGLQLRLAEASRLERLPRHVDPPLSEVATASTTFVDPELPAACLLPRGSVDPPSCVSGDVGSARQAVLVGDSYAGMWSAAASVLASHQHLALTTMAKMACAPWPTAGDLSHGDASCPRWRSLLAGRILALKPTLVLVAVSRGDLAVPARARDAANAAGLAAFARPLVEAGSTVLVLGPTPVYSIRWSASPPPDCLAQHAGDLAACMQARRSVEAANASFAAALRQGARAAGASFQGVLDLLCSPTRCPVVVGQRQVFYNKAHITAAYSRYVGAGLAELVAPRLAAS